MCRETEHWRLRWTLQLVLATAITWLAGAASLVPASAETLIVQGSTTFNRRIMEPLHAAIETAAGHELTVIPNKSTPGLIGLMEGRAHLAMISAPLETEIKILEQVMPGLGYDRLREFRISTTRVAFGVHPSNPVRRTSLASVGKMLLGEIKNWHDVGGRDEPIRVILVGGGGGLTAVVESELLGGQPVKAPNVVYVKTPVQLVQVIQQESGAIGFAQLALVKERGIPELATERPIEQTLSLITLGEPTPAMQAVIDAARLVVGKAM
jgi:phosphate transport system substrate-binding protein